MPPQLQALLQNRNALIGIVAGVVLVLAVIIFMVVGGGGGGGEGQKKTAEKLKTEQLQIASVETHGKAIEIQALLAREGIQSDRGAAAGGLIPVSLTEGATTDDRDRALITMVQSGLMDKNIGLEAFDKGDMTASMQEKRIKLVRAQQGELARLIRRIPPVIDASVSLSIPESSIFKSDQVAKSASIQVTLPNGDRLSRDKVRSIVNLVVGSIDGLDAQHVSLSDTSGNVYNSVIDSGHDIASKIEEQDQYMRDKLAAQLDRLVGPGNYVVTVSTLLREAPKEMMVQTYDPTKSAVSTKQTFSENLNSQQNNVVGGPVSHDLPPEVQGAAESTDKNNRAYNRDGVEVNYANGKMQWVETLYPGMLEDISIAVTIDKNHFPGLPLPELQQLLARTASPKVQSSSVSIASADFQKPEFIPKPDDAPKPVKSGPDWIMWAILAVVVAGFLIVIAVLLMRSNSGKAENQNDLERTQREIQQLREFTIQQQNQLEATQQQAQMLLQQVHQSQQAQQQLAAQKEDLSPVNQLKKTLNEIKEAVMEQELEDDDLDVQIKNWIES